VETDEGCTIALDPAIDEALRLEGWPGSWSTGSSAAQGQRARGERPDPAGRVRRRTIRAARSGQHEAYITAETLAAAIECGAPDGDGRAVHRRGPGRSGRPYRGYARVTGRGMTAGRGGSGGAGRAKASGTGAKVACFFAYPDRRAGAGCQHQAAGPAHFHLYQQVDMVGEYVRLTYIYNPGAAFGIISASTRARSSSCCPSSHSPRCSPCTGSRRFGPRPAACPSR
jgi:hypothetical protein